MISLLISKLGKLISGHSPKSIFALLKTEHYLSEAALAQPDAVVARLQKVLDEWPARPPIGDEPWRRLEHALTAKGYLNRAGLSATKRYVSRT